MNAAKDAGADFDFEVAKVGDGFKFLRDARRGGAKRREAGIVDRLVAQPFLQPVGFERKRSEVADKNRVLAVAAGARAEPAGWAECAFGENPRRRWGAIRVDPPTLIRVDPSRSESIRVDPR